MIVFAYYLLKVILCSGLLYGYYLLALRNRLFHYWNRYYLLATLVISMLLPMVRVPVTIRETSKQPQTVRMLEVVNTGDAYLEKLSQDVSFRFGWNEMAGLVYFGVSLVFLVILLQGILYIRRLIRRNPVKQIDNLYVVSTTEKGAPFSFLRYIFWHDEIPLASSTGQQILRHEIAHVRQKHTLDKVFVQAVLAFYWINPFFWLIRKELGMIHEFIADQESVDHGDTASFAEMILQAAYPQQRFGLSNHFFHSPIQRRIHMLLKSKNSNATYLTRILALPLLALIGVAFSVKATKAASPAQQQSTSLREGGIDQVGNIKKVLQYDTQDTGIVHMQAVKITMTSPNPWDAKEINNSLVIINGQHSNMASLMNKHVEADSAILYPENHPETIRKFGSAGEKGAMEFFNARVSDATEAIQESDVKIYGKLHNTGDTSIPAINWKEGNPQPEPLYVVDGMIISQKAQREVLNLLVKPDEIDRIDVLKGNAAAERYGNQGKNGVIAITTKKAAMSDNQNTTSQEKARIELTELKVEDNTPVYTDVEIPARFPGGDKALENWIRQQVALQNAVQKDPATFKGRAGLRFIVNSVGQVTNVALLNSSTKEYNSKLSLMVSSLLQKGPYWEPARQNGKKVRSFRDVEFEY